MAHQGRGFRTYRVVQKNDLYYVEAAHLTKSHTWVNTPAPPFLSKQSAEDQIERWHQAQIMIGDLNHMPTNNIMDIYTARGEVKPGAEDVIATSGGPYNSYEAAYTYGVDMVHLGNWVSFQVEKRYVLVPRSET